MADRPTRGRTAPGRLRALDAWLCHAERPLLTAPGDAPFVDLGIGAAPWTTLEAAAALGAVNPALAVVGVDNDPERVATAAALAPGDWRVGTFDLPVPARVVRAMNILRAHRPEDVPGIHARIGARLVDGGLLLEGTSDPEGGVLVAHLLRRSGDALRREGLLFHTDFRQGFAPLLFRDRLPRDLRRVAPGTQLHAFFTAWTAAWQPHRKEAPAVAFERSLGGLAEAVAGVDPDPWLGARGYLVWRPPGGVPR